MRLRMRHEHQARIEREIQPLVSVGGPGIGALHAGKQASITRAGVDPQAEGAVDVDPGA